MELLHVLNLSDGRKAIVEVLRNPDILYLPVLLSVLEGEYWPGPGKSRILLIIKSCIDLPLLLREKHLSLPLLENTLATL
jgi:hypothetical protein